MPTIIVPGCVLDLDYTSGVGRHVPDRSANLSGADADGPVQHILPLSYGMRSVVRCFDTASDGSPTLLLQLPPHCGLTGVEFESTGLGGAADVGTLGNPDAFVSGFAVPGGLNYAQSLDVRSQSAEADTAIYLSGITGTFKVRAVFEVRGLPTVTVTIPPLPISVTIIADPDTVAPCETSSLTAEVVNGDGSSGVTWSIVSGPGSLSSITAFSATYNAPCPYDHDAITIIRAVSVEDPSASFETPLSIDFTPEPPDPPVITGVVIGADPTLIALDGGTSLITAYVTGTGDFDAGITFSIVGGTGDGTLSFDTVLTRILDGTDVGTVTVRATSTGDPSKHADVTVTVSADSLIMVSSDDYDHGGGAEDTVNSWRPEAGGLRSFLIVRAYDGATLVPTVMTAADPSTYNPDYNPDYLADPGTGNDWYVSVSGYPDGPDIGGVEGWYTFKVELLGSTAWMVEEPFTVTIYATTEGTLEPVDPYDPVEPPYKTGTIVLNVNPVPHLNSLTVELVGSVPIPEAVDVEFPDDRTSEITVKVTGNGTNLDPWYIGQASNVRLVEQAPDEGLDPSTLLTDAWTDADTGFVEVELPFRVAGTWSELNRQVRARTALGIEPQVYGNIDTFVVPAFAREYLVSGGKLTVSCTNAGPSPLPWSTLTTVTLKIRVRGTGGGFTPVDPTPYVSYYDGVGPGTPGAIDLIGEDDLGGGSADLIYSFTFTAPGSPGGFLPTATSIMRFANPVGMGDLITESFMGGTGPSDELEHSIGMAD